MRPFLLVIFTLSFLHSYGQYTSTAQKHSKRSEAKFLKADIPSLNSETYLNQIKEEYGLSNDDTFTEVKSVKNKSGYTHQKFQQSYKDLEVVGAKYTLHIKNDLVHKSTGRIAPFISINVNPTIQEKDVIQSAKDFVVNKLLDEKYHSFDLEFDFHDIKLCVLDEAYPKFSGNYKLAYQIFAEANTVKPVHEKIYVDAQTGKIISNFTEVCDHSVPGKVKTRYYGTKDIIADSLAADLYVLRDSTRGNGVFTINGPDTDNSYELKYPDFFDEDNVWDNINENFNEVAGDAHYCASSFYDMLLDEFGWSGLDNEGLEFVTVVHASRRFYVNAYWNGDNIFIGNGNCDEYGPLTVLDVIGHEFTHGIIDYSCDLVYQDESGALNESLADIFGKTLEYKYDSENFNWLIGNKFRVEDPEGGFRDMKNPNAENDPKYYLGNDWYFGSGDRGGVHSNSGVFNYWYYLLVEGEQGTNEVGYDYNVEALGIDDAMQIAWSCMTGYFSDDTNYPEAMRLSLEATSDLFGENSQQYESVLEAWTTVGLFEGIDDFDLSLEYVVDEYYGCVDSEIYPEIIVRNSGRMAQDAGTKIELSYIYDDGLIEVKEDYFLPEDLLPGDSILYVFNSAITYFPGIQEDIIVNVYNEDNLFLNNSIEIDLEFSELEGSDIEFSGFTFRVDDVCNPSAISSYRIEFTNNGCLPIIEEDSVVLKITTDLEELEVRYIIYNNVNPGNQIISFRNFDDDLQPGFSEFRVELYFARDSDQANNVFEGSFEISEGITNGYHEKFDDSNYTDKLGINSSSFSARDSVVEYKGSSMYAVARTGNNSNVDKCEFVKDFFSENSKQSTITACLNATGMEDPVFGMDIAQIRNGADDEVPEEFRTIVKVSSDSMSYPLIYNQPNGDVVFHEFELPLEYIGSFKIEIFTYSRETDAFEPVGVENMDAVLLDNLRLFDRALSPQEGVDPEQTEYLVGPTIANEVVRVIPPENHPDFTIQLYDVQGRLCNQQEEAKGVFGGGPQWNFIVANYPVGTYFLTIREGKEIVHTEKIIIVR